MTLCISYLWERLAPNFEVGQLTWLEHPSMPNQWNSRYVGTPALASINSHGYAHGGIDGVTYKRASVLFAMKHGYWAFTVDHRNRVRSDDRISNLKDASWAEQFVNRSPRVGKSGVPGVCWDNSRGKWLVIHKGKNMARLDSLSEAIKLKERL